MDSKLNFSVRHKSIAGARDLDNWYVYREQEVNG